MKVSYGIFALKLSFAIEVELYLNRFNMVAVHALFKYIWAF